MDRREIFKSRVKGLIREEKITQKDLAQECGITEATLSRCINGENLPSSDTLANLATALNTTSDYLIGRSDNDGFEEIDFAGIKGLLARSDIKLTAEEKNKLIGIILSKRINGENQKNIQNYQEKQMRSSYKKKKKKI